MIRLIRRLFSFRQPAICAARPTHFPDEPFVDSVAWTVSGGLGLPASAAEMEQKEKEDPEGHGRTP